MSIATTPGQKLVTKNGIRRALGLDHRPLMKLVAQNKVRAYTNGLGQLRFDLDEVRALLAWKPLPPERVTGRPAWPPPWLKGPLAPAGDRPRAETDRSQE